MNLVQLIIVIWLNQELSKPLVEKVKSKIVNYLKAKGYVTVSAFLPEQDMSQGIVEITVVPGRFGQIILKNSSGIADEVIWNQLAAIKPGDYIIKRNVERALLLVSDLPGTKMKYAQAPGKTAGTVDLIVTVTKVAKTDNYTMSTNNTGNRLFGKNQLGFSAAYANITGIGDKISFRSITSGEGLTGAIISYQMPFLKDSSKLLFDVYKVQYALGEEQTYLDASGQASGIHVGWDYYLVRARDFNLRYATGWDYKNREEDVVLHHMEKSYLWIQAVTYF